MEGYSRKDEACKNLLDLIPKETKWFNTKAAVEETSPEEKKLQLSLGPPGSQDSYAYFSTKKSLWELNQQVNKGSSFLHVPVMKESSQPCSNNNTNNNNSEKKPFSPTAAAAPANTAVGNYSQKRTAPAPAPVVGWPPIRSFRKNIATGSSSKLSPESSDLVPNKPAENGPKTQTLFVKINMDGIPIGRKVDLKAYDSYEKLSNAVDQLFRGLLAAQSDSSGVGNKDEESGGKKIGGLLDGSGEYTLVYEDNEGDRMLVGDVPWHMFVSTVKRLRVLKSSELHKLSRGKRCLQA